MHLNPELKKEIIANITKENNVLQIILFGSYASGNADENSDIDLLIVKEKIQSKWKERQKIRDSIKQIHLAKDIIVACKEEFDFYKHELGSVIKDAYENGEILYSQN
jgi:predicted nucleotidyltransferase